MYSIGVTYWYRYVCFDFSPQEGNICATNREHSWNNFGTWPPQKRSVFGTVSWHFMKTATNRELLPPQIGNFCLSNFKILTNLMPFASFCSLFVSLSPTLQNLHLTWLLTPPPAPPLQGRGEIAATKKVLSSHLRTVPLEQKGNFFVFLYSEWHILVLCALVNLLG